MASYSSALQQPDNEASHCAYPGCTTRFSLFERRHHCRKCGDIFCAAHCSNYFRLDQSISFNPHGDLVRGCDTCARQQQRWLTIMRRASLTAAANKAQDGAIEHNDDQPVKSNTDSDATNRPRIMTNLPPQDMEGISELGRDGKLEDWTLGKVCVRAWLMTVSIDIVKPQPSPSERPINIRQRVAGKFYHVSHLTRLSAPFHFLTYPVRPNLEPNCFCTSRLAVVNVLSSTKTKKKSILFCISYIPLSFVLLPTSSSLFI